LQRLSDFACAFPVSLVVHQSFDNHNHRTDSESAETNFSSSRLNASNSPRDQQVTKAAGTQRHANEAAKAGFKELVVTDIDSRHRRTLTEFGVYQMNSNPAGIGNECTHWIYAALFEARALDRDRALHIGQGHVPYTWGRRVVAVAVQCGDIAQFQGFRNTFFVYQSNGSSSSWMDKSAIRGPNHTGMVFIPPRSGAYYQLESHLHQPGTTVMRVRGNTIYFESFAIALSASDLSAKKGSQSWPSSVDTSDINDMIERIDWTGMRDELSVPLHTADALIARIRRRRSFSPIQVNGSDIACLFVVHRTGDLRFYCPQASSARLGMNDSQLATEKSDLIHSLIRGGRRGGRADEDDYGGDNKRVRLHDHRFDWSFPQQP
jgi:hypothetical protein